MKGQEKFPQRWQGRMTVQSVGITERMMNPDEGRKQVTHSSQPHVRVQTDLLSCLQYCQALLS